MILDSSFLVAVQRKDTGAVRLMEEWNAAGETLRIPAAAWVEFLAGVPPHERRKAVQTLEDACVFEDFERRIADVAVTIQHGLGKSGLPMGWHDLQIGATGLHYREPVVTRDEVFTRIPGLEVIGW